MREYLNLRSNIALGLIFAFLVNTFAPQNGVAIVEQLDPDDATPFLGITSLGGQSMVNMDIGENYLELTDNIELPGVWAEVDTKFKQIALAGKKGPQIFSEIVNTNVIHESNHRDRENLIAQQVLHQNVRPNKLTFEQFSRIAIGFSKDSRLDEALARLGEMNEDIETGRWNDIWEVLLAISRAGGMNNDGLVFAILSGNDQSKVFLKGLKEELNQEKPSVIKLAELMQTKFDSDKLGQDWLRITDRHINGHLQTERMVQIVQEVYPELNKAWCILNGIDPNKANEAMRINVKGGIDFTPTNKILQTQSSGEAIKFHLDSAQLAQLQNAPGFTVGDITIKPLKSVVAFLGLDQPQMNAQLIK